MATLHKIKYYRANGEVGFSGYTISIPKTIAELVRFDDTTPLEVKTENGYIILKRKGENNEDYENKGTTNKHIS